MATVIDLLRSLLIRLRLIPKPDFLIRTVADHPVVAQLEPGVIYVVATNGHRKWAYFLCPTTTGEIIQLSLQPNRRPRWQVTSDFLGRPTIYPSVRQMAGSYAHFWIRNGAVKWCADTGRAPALRYDNRWQA